MKVLLIVLAVLMLAGCVGVPPTPYEPAYGGPGVFVYPTYCYRCGPYYSPYYGYGAYRPYYHWHQFP